MQFQYNDGGRELAGYKGKTSDCVVRAIAITENKPYQEMYDLINEYGSKERITKRHKSKSSARTGVAKKTTRKVLQDLGYTWHPISGIGIGCKMHLKEDEIPDGLIILKLSGHITVCNNKVLNDTYDCSRNGTRCVYGYWKKL